MIKKKTTTTTSARPKHLVFVSSFFLSHVGGVERYVDELTRRLVDRGYRISVISCGFGDEPAQAIDHGRTVWRLPSWPLQQGHYPVPKTLSLRRGFNNLFPDGADLIVTQARFYLLSALGAHLAKQRAIPQLHMEHGSTHRSSPQWWVNQIVTLHDHTIGAYILRSSKRVTAVSPASAAFVTHLGRADVTLMPNGVDVGFFTYQPPRDQPTTIGYAGRLEESKGVHDAIRAFLLLGRSDLTLKIAGDGPYRPSLEKLADNHPNIHFLGTLDRVAMKKFFTQIDILLFPSRQPEGLPTTILEAWASGRIVVGSRIDGVSGLIDHGRTGYLATIADPADLAHQLETVLRLSPEERTTLTQQAYQEIQAHYSWDQITDQFEALIGEML